MLSIGLMSGTSMDGINAALLETDGRHHIHEIADVTFDYDDNFKILLKAAEYAVRKSQGDLHLANKNFNRALENYLQQELNLSLVACHEKILLLKYYLHLNSDANLCLHDVIECSARLHAKAVKDLLALTSYTSSQIQVIGYHGQTVFHQPLLKKTIQLADGNLLAKLTGVTVVYDFRRQDVEAGGQGAPFAPLFHQALAIRDHLIPTAVVNCGGIANVTYIPNAKIEDLMGFDTGPGNGLIDRYVRARTFGKEHMDVDGHYGKAGKVQPTILEALYANALVIQGENYLDVVPPKSLDNADMQLIKELDALSLEDACRTLEAFTADSIVHSIKFFKETIPSRWILCGGGWKNPVIRDEFTQRLHARLNHSCQILLANEIGWNFDAIEAQIFAYFAVRTLEHLPLSVPGTTRVPYPMTGGTIITAS